MVDNFDFWRLCPQPPGKVATRMGVYSRLSSSVVKTYLKERIEGIKLISARSLCFDNCGEIRAGIDVAKMLQKSYSKDAHATR